MNFEELKKNTLSKDKNTLADTARNSFAYIMNYFARAGEEEMGLKYAMGILCNMIASDGTFDNDEWALFSYIIDRDFEDKGEVKELIEGFVDADFVCALDDYMDQADDEFKLNACTLALCVAAIDGRIDENESKLLKLFID